MKKSLFYIFILILPLFGVNDKELFWNTYTAAPRGDKEAEFKTGVMFERGIGTDVNQSQAAKWYQKAAIQGHIDAQYNIGIMYAGGRGVEQNDQFAMMWLASSAKQGDKESRKLLLSLVDGKMNPVQKPEAVVNTIIGMENYIKPVRFETKPSATLCSTASTTNCETLKERQTYTSRSKQGNYYKISGIATGHGWQVYEGNGYIEMKMVEIKQRGRFL